MKRRLNKRIMLLSVVALTVALFQFSGWLQSPAARAQDGRLALFTASQVFGLAQEQRARFCVGTVTSRGPALDWSIRISDERGNLLPYLQQARQRLFRRDCGFCLPDEGSPLARL